MLRTLPRWTENELLTDIARIDARLSVAPGPKLRFGKLRPNGLTRLRPNRARAIAGLPSGKVFHPDEVTKAAKRLRSTGVFRSVVLTEADQVRDGDVLDIDAELTEQKPRRFGFGAEVSSTEGGTLSAFWMHRNLLGGAERLRIDAEISDIGVTLNEIDYRLGINLTCP